jgi:hypothetical protein
MGYRVYRAVGFGLAAFLGGYAGLIYCYGWMVG